MNKIRIAVIIPGGIGTGRNNIGVPVLERLVRILSSDFDITVFSLFKVNKNYVSEGFRIVDVSGASLIMRILKLFRIFRSEHKRDNFMVVHGFWAMPSGFLAVCLGKVFSIKSVVSILGGDAIALPEIQYGQLQRPLYRLIIFWALTKAHAVISLTRYLLNNLERYGFVRKDIHVIPWGIDTNLFSFAPKKLVDPIEFYHVANLHPVKDQGTLIRAFKIVNDQRPSKLTIIGTGMDEVNLRKLISELDLSSHINILDQVPYEALPTFYHRADVLLHTSLSEGQSEVVTEAMSCGIVVCGTSVGLLYDHPEFCLAVPIKDHHALASGILKLLDDPIEMERMRQAARAWTSEHSIYWTANQVGSMYVELIKIVSDGGVL